MMGCLSLPFHHFRKRSSPVLLSLMQKQTFDCSSESSKFDKSTSLVIDESCLFSLMERSMFFFGEGGH